LEKILSRRSSNCKICNRLKSIRKVKNLGNFEKKIKFIIKCHSTISFHKKDFQKRKEKNFRKEKIFFENLFCGMKLWNDILL